MWNGFAQLQVVAVLLVALSGCSTSLNAQSRYVGTLTGCDGAMPATLTRIRNEFAFASDAGAQVIRGTVAADGTLAGQFNTQPPGKPPFVLRVTGQAAPDAVTVVYATPRCTAQGRLTLRPVTLLP